MIRSRTLRMLPALLLALAPCVSRAAGADRPDLVLLNGVVLTMDKGGSTAEAVAVAGDRIVAVGTTAQIRALAGPAARIVDLQGRTLLPGFVDSRIHGPFGFWELASGATLADKSGSPLSQPDEVESALREIMTSRKPAPYEWVVAAGSID